MLLTGHIAASYLIAHTAQAAGIPLTHNEILGVVLAGTIIDLDYIAGLFNGKTGEAHHATLTHTPAGVLLLWTGIVFVFHTPFVLSLILLVSMIVHLMLDDMSYWINRANNPQINWLYPFTPFRLNKLITSTKKTVLAYFVRGRPVVALELLLTVAAISVYLLQ